MLLNYINIIKDLAKLYLILELQKILPNEKITRKQTIVRKTIGPAIQRISNIHARATRALIIKPLLSQSNCY